MADQAITAANVLQSANANVSRVTAGATITQGQVLYLDTSDSKYKLADANGASALIKTPRAIALNGGSNGQLIDVVTEDSDFAPGFTATEGVLYILSGTPGAIGLASDLASGWVGALIGIGKANGNINLKIVIGGTKA